MGMGMEMEMVMIILWKPPCHTGIAIDLSFHRHNSIRQLLSLFKRRHLQFIQHLLRISDTISFHLRIQQIHESGMRDFVAKTLRKEKELFCLRSHHIYKPFRHPLCLLEIRIVFETLSDNTIWARLCKFTNNTIGHDIYDTHTHTRTVGAFCFPTSCLKKWRFADSMRDGSHDERTAQILKKLKCVCVCNMMCFGILTSRDIIDIFR